jgi:ABC-type glycerol-3-phosphate transport system permease component
LRTIPLGLALFESSYFTQYNYQMAVAVTATIPVLVLYLLLRHHIIRGVILSGLRG